MSALWTPARLLDVAMAVFKKVTHVIFDMDGLLLDTEKLYVEAACAVCQRYNKVYTWQMKQHTLGWLGREASRYVVDTLGLPLSPDDYYQLVCGHYRELFPTAALLPDSEEAYNQIFCRVIGQYGKEYPWEVRSKVMGTKEDVSAQMVVQELGLPITPTQFLEQQLQLEKEYLSAVTLMPGAEQLVRHLHRHQVPMAVATSSGVESVDLKLTRHRELFSLFAHMVMGSSDPEVSRGKPAPDIFLLCAARFPQQPQPHEVLVFEDAPNGVVAAVAAGMQVVMVPDPHIPEEQRREATLVLSSLEEFKPETFGLPPFTE